MLRAFRSDFSTADPIHVVLLVRSSNFARTLFRDVPQNRHGWSSRPRLAGSVRHPIQYRVRPIRSLFNDDCPATEVHANRHRTGFAAHRATTRKLPGARARAGLLSSGGLTYGY